MGAISGTIVSSAYAGLKEYVKEMTIENKQLIGSLLASLVFAILFISLNSSTPFDILTFAVLTVSFFVVYNLVSFLLKRIKAKR